MLDRLQSKGIRRYKFLGVVLMAACLATVYINDHYLVPAYAQQPTTYYWAQERRLKNGIEFDPTPITGAQVQIYTNGLIAEDNGDVASLNLWVMTDDNTDSYQSTNHLMDWLEVRLITDCHREFGCDEENPASTNILYESYTFYATFDKATGKFGYGYEFQYFPLDGEDLSRAPIDPVNGTALVFNAYERSNNTWALGAYRWTYTQVWTGGQLVWTNVKVYMGWAGMSTVHPERAHAIKTGAELQGAQSGGGIRRSWFMAPSSAYDFRTNFDQWAIWPDACSFVSSPPHADSGGMPVHYCADANVAQGDQCWGHDAGSCGG